MSGISKSQVSRLCEEIDGKVKAFLDRPIEGDWPYLWLDATYVKVRQASRVVSAAVIVAVGVNSDGRREVLGMDIGPSEAETFWTGFLRKLRQRGLRGVKLVISDAHDGLKAAVAKLLHASWQRCRVHLDLVGKMPTTSVRRLISPFSLERVDRMQLGSMGYRKGHVGQDIGLAVVHEGRRFGKRGSADRRPCATGFGGLGIVLGEGRGNEGGHDPPAVPRSPASSAPSCSSNPTSGRARYMTLETMAPLGDSTNVSLPVFAA